MHAAFVAVLVAVAIAPTAVAAPTVTAPVYDSQGRLVETPFAPVQPPPVLTKKRIPW